jgi:hypothetical protein
MVLNNGLMVLNNGLMVLKFSQEATE